MELKDNELPSEIKSVWFYEENGMKKGPVTEEEIVNLIKSSIISHGTAVWKKGFLNWMPIEATQFSSCLIAEEPPPLSLSKVGSGFFWMLAFAPLFSYAAEWALAIAIQPNMMRAAVSIASNKYFFICQVVMHLIFTIGDMAKLLLAGYDISKHWWTVVPPVYLFKRPRASGPGILPVIIWVVSFVSILRFDFF